MKNTLLLMRKDLNLLFSQILLALLLSIFVGFSFAQQMPSAVFILMMLFVSYFVSVQSFYVEEKNDTMTLLNALPVKANDIVLAKYLLHIVSVGIALCAYALIYGVSVLLQAMGIQLPFISQSGAIMDFVGIPIGIAIGALYTAVFIPPIAKLGVMKARWLLFALYFVGFAGSTSLIGMIDTSMVQTATTWFAPVRPLSYVWLILAAWTILYLSYLLTCNIYRKKRIRGV